MTMSERRNEHWPVNFVHDQLSDGGHIQVLNIVDDGSCLVCRTAGGCLHLKHQDGAVVQKIIKKVTVDILVLDKRPQITGKAMFF
jgi:hypothetical protein